MEESGDESGNKSNAEHPGVDWYTAAWMTMRSGCSVVCVRYSGTWSVLVWMKKILQKLDLFVLTANSAVWWENPYLWSVSGLLFATSHIMYLYMSACFIVSSSRRTGCKDWCITGHFIWFNWQYAPLSLLYLWKNIIQEDDDKVYTMQQQLLRNFAETEHHFSSHCEEYCTSVTSCLKPWLEWTDLEFIFRDMSLYATQFISLSSTNYQTEWWKPFHSPNASDWTYTPKLNCSTPLYPSRFKWKTWEGVFMMKAIKQEKWSMNFSRSCNCYSWICKNYRNACRELWSTKTGRWRTKSHTRMSEQPRILIWMYTIAVA